MPTPPTAEDVAAVCRRRADARADAYREERYRIAETRAASGPTLGSLRTTLGSLRARHDLYADVIIRPTGPTTVSLTLPHIPGSAQWLFESARYIFDVETPGGKRHIVAHTANVYTLEWS